MKNNLLFVLDNISFCVFCSADLWIKKENEIFIRNETK